MDHSEEPKVSTTDAAEAAVVDLIEQHLEEGATHELQHKGLIAEPHPTGADTDTDTGPGHDDPLKPADPFAPDPLPQKPTRDVL